MLPPSRPGQQLQPVLVPTQPASQAQMTPMHMQPTFSPPPPLPIPSPQHSQIPLPLSSPSPSPLLQRLPPRMSPPPALPSPHSPYVPQLMYPPPAMKPPFTQLSGAVPNHGAAAAAPPTGAAAATSVPQQPMPMPMRSPIGAAIPALPSPQVAPMRTPLPVPMPFNYQPPQQNQNQAGQQQLQQHPHPSPSPQHSQAQHSHPLPAFGSHLHLPPGISPPPPLLPNGSPVSSTVLQYSPSFSSFNGSNPGSARSSFSAVPPPPQLRYTHTPPSPMQTFLPSPTHISGPFPNSSPSHAANGTAANSNANTPAPFSLLSAPLSSPPPLPSSNGSSSSFSFSSSGAMAMPSHSPSPTFQAIQTPSASASSHGIPPPPALPRTHASQMGVLTQMQTLHLDGSTRDYPLPSPHSASRTPLFNPTPSPSAKHVSPTLPSFDLALVEAHQASLEAEEEEEEEQRQRQSDNGATEEEEYNDQYNGEGEDPSGQAAPRAEPDSEDDEDGGVEFDPSDLLGRLCSSERIRADDTSFWSRCMEGMEWAFWDSDMAPEAHRLVQQYCKSFVATAARSRNLHAMLLVICRHLENYSQSLHLLSTGGAGAASPGAASVSSPVSVSAAGALSKDHVWVTQLLFFLRVFVQYLLTNLPYEDTLRFFSHLAVPDAASKPATPKAPSSAAVAMSAGMGTGSAVFGGQEQWSSMLTVPGQLRGSRSPSPPSPGGGRSTGSHTPLRHHTINLNPNSRRSSLNPQSDILTRFVCAIANTLEVLGDAPLNQSVANAKLPKNNSKAAAAGTAKAPASSPTSAATTASTSSAVAAGLSPTSSSSGKGGSQPLADLHLELLNTMFVLVSSQMYLPLSTEHEQIFLDRLLYCAKPPLLNSMQGLVTGLIAAFTEILPADYASTVFQRAHAAPSSKSAAPQGFFSKITSKISNLFYFPVWAVRYLFTIPPNHPLVDRSTLLLELLVYQSSDNAFRTAIRQLKDADPPSTTGAANGMAVTSPSAAAAPLVVEDFSHLSQLEKLEAGAISFSKLYYSLCSTLLSEHINLFLYTLIHENASFLRHVLVAHAHDLDYMLMPQLEILYREVDISKHHVYMVINIWILLTQQQGFDHAIKTIRVKEVPFFKEMPLKDLTLTQVMQIVLLRTLQLNLKSKLKEPQIFNNVAAAFCNLTITALIGPPLPEPSSSGSGSATSPTASGVPSPSSSSASPGSGGTSTVAGGNMLALPLTLHPQVSFRLIRVLCILSRKFIALQVRHEAQIGEHNARVELMNSEGREELTEEEEREEVELEDVAEELGTCMEFIQLLLEVVNHAIVHALPAPNPLSPPDHAARLQQEAAASGEYRSSLASNPSLLYNLVHSKEYFLQLLPYAHLFEANLISNITNTIAFYEVAPGVSVPSGTVARAAAAGAGSASHASRQSEREVERCVAALTKAISHTPMSNTAHSTSPHSPTGSAPLPPGSCPHFDSSALIERGPFTYHEQQDSQDFFVPYIYQLAQTMRILPRMYAPDGPSPAQAQAALDAAAGAMGDVDADAEFIRELEAEEEEEILADEQQRHQMQQSMMDGNDSDDDPIAAAAAAEAAAQLEDTSKLRIAIK